MTDLPGIILLGLRFGLAICLYLFLFWALRILWRDLKASIPKDSSSPPPLVLNFSGESETEKKVILTAAENLLGRAPECNLHLLNSTVSTTHARIYFSQTQWWLEDLNSSNGTFLNGIKIDQPVVLASQDQLSLGSLEAVIEIHSLND
ncbi:MAG: FHA domain-containing protein [Anaerolineales bacterium]|nr:FHA domain-containing protein [Anaerolineales bacterium]